MVIIILTEYSRHVECMWPTWRLRPLQPSWPWLPRLWQPKRSDTKIGRLTLREGTEKPPSSLPFVCGICSKKRELFPTLSTQRNSTKKWSSYIFHFVKITWKALKYILNTKHLLTILSSVLGLRNSKKIRVLTLTSSSLFQCLSLNVQNLY